MIAYFNVVHNAVYSACLLNVVCCFCNMEHIGPVVRMSVSGYRGYLFKSQHQYVVSLNKTLYLHCFSRLSSKMSARWEHPREGCSVL